MIDIHSNDFKTALRQASREQGMPDYYEPCVPPLFTMPMSQWPMCCGGGCEPCAKTLVTIALRMCELLDINPDHLS